MGAGVFSPRSCHPRLGVPPPPTHTHTPQSTARSTLPETELPSMFGVSASHRQVQWTKVEHIPETLHAAHELINLPGCREPKKKHREVVIIPSGDITGEDTHSGYTEHSCHCAGAWLCQL